MRVTCLSLSLVCVLVLGSASPPAPSPFALDFELPRQPFAAAAKNASFGVWEPALAFGERREGEGESLMLYLTGTICADDAEVGPGKSYPHLETVMFTSSADGGESFSTPVPPCPCVGRDTQADGMLAVASEPRSVVVTFMDGWSISATRSLDGGVTWSAAVPVGDASYTADKNAHTVSPDGSDIVVTWNINGDVYAASSLGNSNLDASLKPFSEQQLILSECDAYFFGGGGVLLSHPGTSAFVFAGGIEEEAKQEEGCTPGATLIRVAITHDTGRTWSIHVVDDLVHSTQVCPDWAHCEFPDEYLAPMATIATSDDVLYVSYYGRAPQLSGEGPARSYLSLSRDGGKTWSARSEMGQHSSSKVFHMTTMVAARAFVVVYAWMDNHTGDWGMYVRRSDDGGSTFGETARVDVPRVDGAAWETDKGFKFPYGDYGGLGIDPRLCIHIAWGEGVGWYAGGGVYYTKQRATATTTAGGWGCYTGDRLEVKAIAFEEGEGGGGGGRDETATLVVAGAGTVVFVLAVVTILVLLRRESVVVAA